MTIERRRVHLRGRLQGVGFRPFVARLARECRLSGRVANAGDGVIVELEGHPAAIDRLIARFRVEGPPQSSIEEESWEAIDVRADTCFEIANSEVGVGPRRISIVPDRRICEACLREIRDPKDRRFGHAFASCTDCGPRFCIATDVPFDREATTMGAFAMCDACRAEYETSGDRRHHAQTVACPRCGPRLRLLDSGGTAHGRDEGAIDGALAALRRGETVALQGVGGFQLLVDATSEPAVARLRERKRRPAKPLALMVTDLEMARRLADLDRVQAQALEDPSAPIVLVDGRGTDELAPSVAPNRARLGLMLPTTPLHQRLLDRFERPVVATSGNRHEEPIAIEIDDALERLGKVADVFLVHDRKIARRCDDSVVHVVAGQVRVLRLGRGLAPTSLPFVATRTPLLALGGHLKQAPALAQDGEIVLWPHVGDLFELSAREAMEDSLADLQAMTHCGEAVIVADAHPDYATAQWAHASGRTVERVWHHHAHVAAVLAEHGRDMSVGLAWDGTGLGPDGSAWGGEVLAVAPTGMRRVGHFLPFSLPGGDAAARDGRRALAGLFAAAGLPPLSDMPELSRWMALAADPRLSPPTTSVGRLFDAVAALVGVCTQSRYEGEAAARLEELVRPSVADLSPYPFAIENGVIDWRPALVHMIDERGDPARVAARFHATLAAIAVEIALGARAKSLVLSGGCFQNRSLCALVIAGLHEQGVEALLPARVPVSDGGLALGQAWVVAHRRGLR